MNSEIHWLSNAFSGFGFQPSQKRVGAREETTVKAGISPSDRFERNTGGDFVELSSLWQQVGQIAGEVTGKTNPQIPQQQISLRDEDPLEGSRTRTPNVKITSTTSAKSDQTPKTITIDTFSQSSPNEFAGKYTVPVGSLSMSSSLRLPSVGDTIPTTVKPISRSLVNTQNRTKENDVTDSKSAIATKIEQTKEELRNFDYNKGLEAREKLVQELNDLIDKQNQLLSSDESRSKGIKVKFAGNVSSKEATEIGQSLNINNSILEKYNVKQVIAAHADDGNGVWRINGFSETAERIITSGKLTEAQKIEKLSKLGNLDLVGEKFASNLEIGESICVLGCKGKNGTNGFIFTKQVDGKVEVESITLSEAKELASGVRLGGDDELDGVINDEYGIKRIKKPNKIS